MTPGSPQNKPLQDIREQIDSIDQQIVRLIAERQKWVLAAGSLKKDEQGVRAPARVDQVIAQVRSLAEREQASPEVVERTYRALIDAFINLELSHHRGLAQSSDGHPAPPHHP